MARAKAALMDSKLAEAEAAAREAEAQRKAKLEAEAAAEAQRLAAEEAARLERLRLEAEEAALPELQRKFLRRQREIRARFILCFSLLNILQLFQNAALL